MTAERLIDESAAIARIWQHCRVARCHFLWAWRDNRNMGGGGRVLVLYLSKLYWPFLAKAWMIVEQCYFQLVAACDQQGLGVQMPRFSRLMAC